MKTIRSKKNSMLKYVVFEEKFYSEEVGEYIGYGIICYNEFGQEVERIEDISLDKKFVRNLARKFNKFSLSAVHFMDAVLDAIDWILNPN